MGLFDPPSKEELSMNPKEKTKGLVQSPSDSLFAPPTEDELKGGGFNAPSVPSYGYDENSEDFDVGAAARGLKQGVPFGGYINNAVALAKSGFNTSNPDYVKIRDEMNRADEEAYQKHPWSYRAGFGGGLIGGGLLGGAAVSGASKLLAGGEAAALGAEKIAELSQKAKLIEAAKAGAKAGGLYGLLNDPGDVEGKVEPLQLPERAAYGALGAGLGAGAGVVGEVGGQLAKKGVEKVSGAITSAGEKLDEAANRWATYSLRGMKKDIRKVFEKDEIEQIGKELLDQGIIGKIPKSAEALAEETGKRSKEFGKVYGDILKEIDPKVGKVIDRREVTNRVRESLKIPDESLPYAKEFNERLEEGLHAFEGSQGKLGISDLQKIKQTVSDMADWNGHYDKKLPVEVAVARQLFHSINNTIDETADKLVPQMGVKVTAENLQSLRQRIYNLKVANTIANGRNLAEVHNRFISPSDYMTGIAGAVNSEGGGLSGLAYAIAHKMLRERGGQAVATGAKGLSRGLLSAGKLASKVAVPAMPLAKEQLVQGLLQSQRKPE